MRRASSKHSALAPPWWIGAALDALDRWAMGRGSEHRLWAWSESLEGVGAGKQGKLSEKDGHIVDAMMATIKLLPRWSGVGSQHSTTRGTGTRCRNRMRG